MKSEPLISVIVPIYDAEKYLYRCLDSILAQTFADWECILVDDGSKDRSGAICDEYAVKDSRFHVIHKQNGGVSSARQAGLDAAKGDFVIHTDSDDWLDPFMLEELMNHLQKTGAECVIFDFFRVTNGKKVRQYQAPTNYNHKQVLKDIIGGKIYACCWNKLIKISTIKKWRASFPKNIDFGEDKCFLASLLRNPVSVSYLPQSLYYYDASINSDSLVRNISKKSMEYGFAMVDYLENTLGKEYAGSVNMVKRNLKLRAISSGYYKDHEIRLMYKEVNSLILFKLFAFRTHSIYDIVLILYSLGIYRVAKYIYNRVNC